MSEHTPGKLVVRGGYSIYAEDGKTPVADACLSNSVATHDEANARRLVACWNALDGLSQDALDGGWNFKDADAYTVRVEKDRDSLRAVNAELLEALKPLAAYPLEEFAMQGKDDSRPLFGANDWQLFVGHVKAARAAIARATAPNQGEQV